MDESILTSIKKLLGISESDATFDLDIIMHISSVLMILTQIGVGPDSGFSIQGSSSRWSDFIGSAKNLEAIKSYVLLKVRLLFDPPLSSAVTEAMNRMISELEWRININADKPETTSTDTTSSEIGASVDSNGILTIG